jgi:hypothetical protein
MSAGQKHWAVATKPRKTNMTQNKSLNKPQKDSAHSLDENSIRILMKENEILQTLFIQSENGIQSIFNFYLTLVTAVAGGITIILQVTANNPAQTWWAMISISSLLIFIAISGSAYMFSLAVRYAHTIRYARGIDEIRRFLINQTNIAAPAVYRKFLNNSIKKEKGWIMLVLSMLVPVGTHQLFMATVNSLAWAVAGYILLFIGGMPEHRLDRSVILFLTAFIIYNVYANLIMRRIIANLNIQVEI